MLGIIFEGGASRTVYSCGIMDALLEEGIMADKVFGVSAGAAFGVSYVSGQIGRNYRLAAEFMGRPEYMGPKHLINPKNRSYYNLQYAFDDVPNIHLPFDYEAFKANKCECYAVVTNVQTGEAEYMLIDGTDRHWQIVRATCALPLLFPEIEVGGQKYLDGGIADSIPYKKAMEMGCDKLIIVLTRPRDYRKTTDRTTQLCIKRYAAYPEFTRALADRAERYNQCVEEIQQLRREGKAVVFTPKTTFGVNRIEGDSARLKRLYDHGYNHARAAMGKVQAYLKERT